MTMQLPQSFKTPLGRQQLESGLSKNKIDNKDILNDLLFMTETLSDKSLDITLEELQALGDTISNIDSFKFNELSKVQQEPFVTVKKALQQSWPEIDDDAVASYLRITAKLLKHATLTNEQVNSFTSSTPAKIWLTISMGVSLATLPAAIFSIVVGQSLTQVSAWRSAVAAVMATGVGAAIAAFFKVRTTTRKRNDGLKIANIKEKIQAEYNEAINKESMKNALNAIKEFIERKLSEPELAADEKAKLEKDLETCKTIGLRDLHLLNKQLKAKYPQTVENILLKIEQHHHLQKAVLTDVKNRDEARNTKGYQVWKYMSLGSGIFTGINATWLFVTVFGSFWGIAKAGIIAGGLGAFLSGPAFPFVAAAVGTVLVAALVGVTIYSVFKKWRYDAEQKAVNAMVKHETEKSENLTSLQKDIKELSHQHAATESLSHGEKFGRQMARHEILERKLQSFHRDVLTAQDINRQLKSELSQLSDNFNSLNSDIREIRQQLNISDNKQKVELQKSLDELTGKLNDLNDKYKELRMRFKNSDDKQAAQFIDEVTSRQRPSSPS